ncbi:MULTISPECIES: hypothetical protein [Streptomyces]|nr:hypothetical protein [Streptomyces sp. SID7805]
MATTSRGRRIPPRDNLVTVTVTVGEIEIPGLELVTSREAAR